MAVVKNLSGLQTAKTGMAPDQTHGVLDELARMWAAQYAQTEERARAIPELPLRASYTSMRCDRALGYAIAKVPYTNPPDITDQIRMWYGTIVHNAVDVALDTLGSWATELPVDLRPIGYAGSATGDLVIYRDEQPVAVFDFKTVGGFAFKQKATAYQGPPQGPSIDQILQPGLAALALGAPKFGVIMFSLEPVSKQQARNVGDQDIDRLWAQWTFDTADWEQDIRAEVARQMRVLQWVVERCQGRARAIENAVGLAPAYDDVNWTGTEFGADQFETAMRVHNEEWKRELVSHDELFAKVGAKLPVALQAERERLGARLRT